MRRVFEVRVVDAARELTALGVGINILPHATRELVELGLADELTATGIPTDELIYHDRFGSRICVEPRGLAAGYRPMYPFGSNGGTQAIIDGRVLAWELAHADDPVSGLACYEEARREQMNALVLAIIGFDAETLNTQSSWNVANAPQPMPEPNGAA